MSCGCALRFCVTTLPSLTPRRVQVRRDDVLAIQNTPGMGFHDACRAAFTQSLDNVTRSAPCSNASIDQGNLNCDTNDLPFTYRNNTQGLHFDYGGRVFIGRSERKNLTCAANPALGCDGLGGPGPNNCSDCFPLVMMSEVRLAGVDDHDNADPAQHDGGAVYDPVSPNKSPTGFYQLCWAARPENASI